MKTILLIEKDTDICDFIREYAGEHLNLDYEILFVKGISEALPIVHRQRLDAVVIDALPPSVRDVFDFIRDARHHDANLPMVALVAYSDMILNETLKKNLLKERVSIIDKTHAFKEENLRYLFQAACEHGMGEEL